VRFRLRDNLVRGQDAAHLKRRPDRTPLGINKRGMPAIVSVWTPLMSETIAARWFAWPNIVLLAPVPLATAAFAWLTWHALGSRAQATPFLGAIGLFVLSYLGIAISLYPMIVPFHFTLWEAASSLSTQAFLLVGTLVLLPVILMYTGWSYWVFRGKVRSDIGYH
jgi:cytochrome bd ubiquinol oxidase subunit II